MFHWRSNRFQKMKNNAKKLFFILSFFFCVLIFLFSCAFADLRPIGISTVPEEAWALLPAAESPVIVRFDTGMDRTSVENAFQIISPGGLVEGKFHWENNDLFFTPVSPWLPGIRYALKLSGSITARDGRESLVYRDLPFYAVSRVSLPYLVSFYPPDNASVAVDMAALEFSFSHPMNRRSVEDAIRLDTGGEAINEWLDDDKVLRVRPGMALNPWTVYRWAIGEKALSREGAPLAREYSGRFISDLDREIIRVLRVLPLMPPSPDAGGGPGIGDLWGSWVPAGVSLEQGPGFGHGIGVEFSKVPDSDSLRRAFSFVPSLPGRVEILSPVSAVYIPSRDPEPLTVYSMRISGALRDKDGLGMGDDFVVTFIPDLVFLEVNSISSVPGEEVYFPGPGSLIQAQVSTGGIIRLIINFSLSFYAEDYTAMEESAFKISLRPFFPNSLSPVSLRSASWLFRDRLLLEWEGAERGSAGEPHYYRLLIPGAAGGVHNGRGSFMKEDFILFLEAK